MKKIIIILYFSFPIILFSQEIEEKTYLIWLETNLNLSSNSLDREFMNTFLYGGEITDSQKNDWIQGLKEKNTINIELNNSVNFKSLTQKNIFSLTLLDRNLLNSSFNDDLFKLLLQGNYPYQGDTLLFNNTVLDISRFQQIKFGYKRDLSSFGLGVAFSFLNGNHHYSLLIDKGILYTEMMGTHLYLNYDMSGFATDTKNLSLFSNNGWGIATDFELNYKKNNIIINWYVKDLGFINWKEESILYNADSNFVFNGIQVDDFIELHDSIIQNEIDNFEDHISRTERNTFKTYIPANFGISAYKKMPNNLFSDILIGLNFKWRPNEDNLPISIEKINQGIKESNYTPLFYLKTSYEMKYLSLIPHFSYGGFAENFNFGLGLNMEIKKLFTTINVHHINEIFEGEKSRALDVYLQLGIKL